MSKFTKGIFVVLIFSSSCRLSCAEKSNLQMMNDALQGWDKMLARGATVASLLYMMKLLSQEGGLTAGFQTHTIKPVEVTDTTLKDYIGVPNDVKVLVDQIKNPEKYKDITPTKGILLTGNPGTGKSFLARAIAGETKCPFFSVSATELQQPYKGVSASMVRSLFRQAKLAAMKSPSKTAIIFIDEIDAIGRTRVGLGQHGGADVLETLLTEMDGFSTAVELSWYEKVKNYFVSQSSQTNVNVVILAATNIPQALDSALKRPGRFDSIIQIELPDAEAREKIITSYLQKYSYQEDVTLKKLAEATEEMTPAAIKTVVVAAARMATADGRNKISIKDFDNAILDMKERNAQDSKDEATKESVRAFLLKNQGK